MTGLGKALTAAALLPPVLLNGAFPASERALGALLAAAGAAILWLRRARPGVKGPEGAAWALGIASLVSAVFSPFPHGAVQGLVSDLAGVALFLSAASSPPEDAPFRQGLSAAAFAVMAPSAFFNGLNPPDAPLWGNPNILAGALLLTWPVAAGLLWKRSRPAALLPLLLALAALLICRSRPALLVFAVEAVLLGAAFFRGGLRLGRGAFAVLCLAALAAVGAAWTLDGDRSAWWRAAGAMGADSPLWGQGPGTFGEAFPGFRAEPSRLNTLFAHGLFFEAFAEKGLLGLGALSVLLIFLSGRVAGRTLPPPAAAAGLGAAAFAAYNLVHVGFSMPGAAWLFWAQAGLFLALTRPADERNALSGKAGAWLAGVLLTVTAAPALLLGRGGIWLDRARDAKSPSARESSASKGLRWTPWEPELYSLRAAAKAERGAWEEAEADASRAARLSPHSARFRAERGEIALRLGRRDEALSHYREAVRLLPMNEAYRKRLEEIAR